MSHKKFFRIGGIAAHAHSAFQPAKVTRLSQIENPPCTSLLPVTKSTSPSRCWACMRPEKVGRIQKHFDHMIHHQRRVACAEDPHIAEATIHAKGVQPCTPTPSAHVRRDRRARRQARPPGVGNTRKSSAATTAPRARGANKTRALTRPSPRPALPTAARHIPRYHHGRHPDVANARPHHPLSVSATFRLLHPPRFRAGPCDAQGRNECLCETGCCKRPPCFRRRTLLTTNDLSAKSQSATLKLAGCRLMAARARSEPSDTQIPGMALVGHLTLSCTRTRDRRPEIKYRKTPKTARPAALRQLFGCERIRGVVVANGAKVDLPDLGRIRARRLALFATPLPSPVVIDNPSSTSRARFAPRLRCTACTWKCWGWAYCSPARPASAKSELALELLSRGHRLIVDDAVGSLSVGPTCWSANVPGSWISLEVRGLGILDIRPIVRRNRGTPLQAAHLSVLSGKLDRSRMGKIDRLQAQQRTRAILWMSRSPR